MPDRSTPARKIGPDDPERGGAIAVQDRRAAEGRIPWLVARVPKYLLSAVASIVSVTPALRGRARQELAGEQGSRVWHEREASGG